MPQYFPLFHSRIQKETKIVLVEGIFVCKNDGEWSEIPTLFDWKLFLSVARDKCIQRLLQRHRDGGKTSEQAQAHMERVDIPNLE